MKLIDVLRNNFESIDDPEQIANLCRDKNIQGFLNNDTSCPMVKLIREQVDFFVGFSKINGVNSWWCVDNGQAIIIAEYSVCDRFKENFDRKDYPDLIAEVSMINIGQQPKEVS